MREKLNQFFQSLRDRVANFRARHRGLSFADGLRNAGTTLGPMAQRGLLRMPGLDQTLARLKRYQWAVWLVAGFLSADLAMTGVGNYLGGKAGHSLTTTAPAHHVVNLDPYVRNFEEYNPILTANPFCPGCPIPDLAKLQRPKDCGAAKPLAGGGGVKLIGTIVLSDPKYSVATVARGSDSLALQKGDTMPGIGEVYEIRQGRVCFLIGTGALQFIDLPADFFQFASAPAAPKAVSRATPSNTPGIDKVSDTEFVISRDALNKKLEDPSLLSDAHAVPFRDDGELKGFKIITIKPGSVYESLGVQVGDVINGVNGEAMNSVAKAQELFVSLRTQDKISITVNRGGQDVTMSYSIR